MAASYWQNPKVKGSSRSFVAEFSVFQVMIIKLSLVEMPVAELCAIELSADVLLTVELSVS